MAGRPGTKLRAELGSGALPARGDLKRAESLLGEAAAGPVPELEGNVELARAQFLLARSRFDEANDAARKSAGAFSEANLDVESAQALTAEADALEMLGRPGDALAACRDAEQRATRTANQLPVAFARLPEWRLTGDSGAALPAELKISLASLRNPERDLAVQYAAAMRAERAGLASTRRLFLELASAAANRGYVALSRRAHALGQAP